MARAKLEEDDFILLWRDVGPSEMQRQTDLSSRQLYARRRNIEVKRGIVIRGPVSPRNGIYEQADHPGEIRLDIQNGTVVVGSDCHYWPGKPSVAHRAFVKFIRELKPVAVVLNGDVIDACTISRHPPIGWENRPTVKQEIEAAQERLGEIENAAGKARKIWTLGNHDARFETRLATVAPEFAKVEGVHLHDHFALWENSWLVRINDDVVIKHRFKGGIHAPHNNTMWAGTTMVTGHLHSAKVTPLTDYNGTRYGVDTGCIADVSHRVFLDYTEGNPKNWRSGFGVLSFHDGKLLMPELVLAWDADHVQFRGEVIKC